jgi:predicted phage terminase large subunit-like protein
MDSLVELPQHVLDTLTEAEKEEYETQLGLYNDLRTPLTYMCKVDEEAEPYAHIAKLDEHTVALLNHCLYPWGIGPQAIQVENDVWVHPETGEETVQFMAITMPPRHGKSFYVSHHLPAWYLTRYPDNSIILTTHEAEFSEDWSDLARNLVRTHPEYGVFIDPKNDSKARWKIRGRRGALRCAGAGGSISGKKADLLLGDDLIKNAEQAYSKVQRDSLWKWYMKVWKTRREPNGVGIMMFTRWHEDDIIGRAIKKERKQWFLLNMPALAFDEVDSEGYSIDPDTKVRDLLNRRPGEALCPQRFPARALLRIKSGEEKADDDIEGGEITFTAMYQGKPSIEGGGIIRRPFCRYQYIAPSGKEGGTYRLLCKDGTIKFVKEMDCWRFATVDIAATIKERSDYTVLSVWDASRTGELMWRDCLRVKIESSEHVDFIIKHVGHYQTPKIRLTGIESITYGLSLIQKLRKTARKIILFVLKPDKDKVARAIPFGMAVAEGKVFFPELEFPSRGSEDQVLLGDAEEEIVKFPNAPHDDIVDTCAYAVEMWGMAPKERKVRERDDSSAGRAHRNVLRHKKRPKRHTGRLGE